MLKLDTWIPYPLVGYVDHGGGVTEQGGTKELESHSSIDPTHLTRLRWLIMHAHPPNMACHESSKMLR